MKIAFFRTGLLLLSIVILNSCKSDDDSDDYTPLNIIANADSGEVFQNAVLEIAILENDSNIPIDGEITITNPQTGFVTIIDPNGTPNTILDDVIKYTPSTSFIGEDVFEYTVCDTSGQSCATGTVTVNVLPFSPVNFDINNALHETLSEYNFFEGTLADLLPVYGVLPYEPISTLFTDYAHKKRFIWMPYNVKATYSSDGDILNFPTGTILIKTFYYDNVLPNNTTKIIETRLLIKKDSGWIFADYIWNEDQSEAILNTTGFGFNVDVNWVQDGEIKNTSYRIPSETECLICHKQTINSIDIPIPIGPKPQNLNANYSYSTGVTNQIEKWIDIGYLSNSDLPSNIETVVDWTDSSQDLKIRIRSYLDINCAHCHVTGGHCGERELRLAFRESNDIENMGVCVTPDLQVPGFDLDPIIIPGDAENSVLFYRASTTLEEYRMPMNGRTLPHDEFLSILEEWINSLTTACD